MPCRKIELTRYARHSHFEYFKSLPYPYVGVTQEVDVTDVVRFCKKNGHSFYIVFLHAAALAADDVAELRQRIRNGGIVEYDECPTSHIELLDDGTYCYCTLRHHMPMETYISYAQEERIRCRRNATIEEGGEEESLYFVSTLPWLHYSALIQPVAGGEEANPRITWGKFEENPDGRLMLPVTLLAHHALVDGIHIARFYQNLTQQIALLTRESGSDEG